MRAAVVLVVRKDDVLSSRVRGAGCEVVNLELIRTGPVRDLSRLSERLDLINEYDGLFFTSPAAAVIFVEQAKLANTSYAGKIFVLGERARAILENAGYEVAFAREANTVKQMLEAFGDEAFAGKRFLFIRGNRSLGAVRDLLKGKATVDEVVVYETKDIEPDKGFVSGIRERLIKGEIDWICFFSPSGVKNFRDLFSNSELERVKVAVIGKTTAEAARQLKLNVDLISPQAAAEGFADALLGQIQKH